jgi:hypothetical protein
MCGPRSCQGQDVLGFVGEEVNLYSLCIQGFLLLVHYSSAEFFLALG